MVKELHIHLVSDATGETNHQIVRACMAQFPDARAKEHVWSLVRSPAHVEKIFAAVKSYPGPVFFTLVDVDLRRMLMEGCKRLSIPCVSALDPVLFTLGDYFGVESMGAPGRQHRLNAAYFKRIEAMDYTLAHDDGQNPDGLYEADIIIVGVSRTSKTPTALYLANRGYKTANIPVVPEIPLPEELAAAKQVFVAALTNDPARLVQVRRNRLLLLNQKEMTDYIDLEKIRGEVVAARRVFSRHGWPVIDVTRRSIEETAAAVLQHYATFNSNQTGSDLPEEAP